MTQNEMANKNRKAWEASSYQAWVSRYGTADHAAAQITSDPKHTLRRLLAYIGDPCGQSIANPLGSHGRVATAMALLGASVTVFDLSESNARYARELAAAADVAINYVVGDLLLNAHKYTGEFDAVVMELGIVHYFCSIEEFADSIKTLLVPGGRVVLVDFHPVQKKIIKTNSGKPLLSGDYFNCELEEVATPYEVFVEEEVPECLIRRWTLGEIVTAFASSGFRIEQLIEQPYGDYLKIPGMFTLVATNDCVIKA